MELTLIRHATLLVDVGGRRLLVDPMLDRTGARPPIDGTPSPRDNPLVPLPRPVRDVIRGVDAVLVTHLHTDHLDGTAVDALPSDLPVLCQPADEATLRGRGFTRLEPVDDVRSHGGLRITRTGGRHGTGELAERLGPVSGFVVELAGEPVLYVAGDTVPCDEVRRALAEHRPDVVVLNAGGARFLEGDAITMTADDVVAVRRSLPRETAVAAVHMDAVNHCLVTRAKLRERLAAEGLADGVLVPEDGESLAFAPDRVRAATPRDTRLPHGTRPNAR